MAAAGVHTFTDDNFEAEVLQSSQPVLVDFWAEWCGPCKMLAPTIDQLAAEMGDRIRIGKLDIDKHPVTPGKYNIYAIPTVLVFKNGSVVQTFQGLRSKADLKKALEAVA